MPDLFVTKSAPLTAAMASLVLLSACNLDQPAKLDSDELSEAEDARRPLPIVEPPLDRSRLLLAVARAASAYSTGSDDAGLQRSIDGKQFEVRLRFGCDGQGPRDGDHGWSVDPDGQTLRVRLVPTLSLEDEAVRSVAGVGAEAAGGFWLPRPWMLQAACPAAQSGTAGEDAAPPVAGSAAEPAPTPPDPPAPSLPRIGLAQFYSPDDARTGRRMNRPFEAVKQIKDASRIAGNGFNLVLAGRLRARGDGRVILCAGVDRGRPPDCVVSAEIDRLWIEQPQDRAVIAEWSV